MSETKNFEAFAKQFREQFVVSIVWKVNGREHMLGCIDQPETLNDLEDALEQLSESMLHVAAHHENLPER